ncbi:CoA-binding protein [Nonlabens xiamenensis]|uniref:CoA-binding protein n=1 Tax=Nonlabens xiamenensis TaxID=2341043 RepID=UPI000F60C00E|nr:CoA-binding protein [Nonlabens xiamenensis]
MSKKTLVLGASLKVERYSNIAIHRLRKNNIETVAIGLREGVVDDVKIHTEMVPFTDINTVTLYLNPKRQVSYYDYILNLRPERVIFNPGTENPEFQQLLKENGIFPEVACTLVMLGTRQY